jgi:Arc/MetJ-type ribon-helix-helix transcriptional regulator
MELVSVRFQEDVLKSMDDCISRNHFNSRTEFIRVAVSEKISSLSRQELLEEFLRLQGAFKGRNAKGTRAKVGKAIMERFGIKD